jgi:hypothetical protein
MSTPTITTHRARTRERIGVIAGAVLAPAAVWVVADPLLGHRLTVEPWNSGEVVAVPLSHVLVTALLAALVGWAALAVLGRLSRHGRTIWTIGGLTLLVLSLGGPAMAATTTTTAVALILMHLAVGVVLIGGMRRIER